MCSPLCTGTAHLSQPDPLAHRKLAPFCQTLVVIFTHALFRFVVKRLDDFELLEHVRPVLCIFRAAHIHPALEHRSK